ncbi:hypothetical protein F0Q53_02435 [Anaplasma marginale]|uniref:Uncharacterized protein n=1 Tax=Anaplasma marginale TaxID=770 RepID=A0A643CLZ6_ANAMA|nr:hypothetical protein [Anaplasma marginale]KAA8474525.1 hypothetical protein F0Q53_02435 [Anaplasma marginale]KAB0452186.1 hypothetical protein FY207_01875 [Anaplasma marginale]
MRGDGDDDVESGVRALILRKPISNVYFRLGVLCATLFATVAAFAFAYAISAGVAFSWYAPVFIVAVASTVSLLISLTFVFIMSALQSRSGRVQHASGTIQAPFGCPNRRFEVSVRRHGVQAGYGVFQSVLACAIACSLITAALVSGVIVGKSQTIPAIASLISRVQSVESVIFLAAVAAFLISCFMLFCVRVFTDGATPCVNMFVVVASESDPARAAVIHGGSSRGSVVQEEHGVADGTAAGNARIPGAKGERSSAHDILQGTSWINALMGLGSETSGVCVKCVIDARSPQ